MAEDGHRRFRWWMPVLGLVVLVVVGVGVVVVLFIQREEPEARSVDEAVGEFRSTTPEGSTDDEAAIPPVGVYEVAGEGSEQLSFPPIDQADGATIPMTIAAAENGCWTWRLDYNEAHYQDWTLCREGEVVREAAGHTWQRWDLGATTVENLSTFTCDPPEVFLVLDAEPGTSWDRSCTGVSDQVSGETVSAGTVTFVGPETVTVDGEPVDALRYRADYTISGAQTGSNEFDLWFRSEDGLPLRGDRVVRVDSSSPVGTITYTEEGTWQIVSLEPRR